MLTSIIMRVADPARLAAIARAVGVDMRDPNRPNPGAWHFDWRISIVITESQQGKPSMSIGPGDFDGSLAEISALLGAAAVQVSGDGNSAEVLVPDGPRVTLERDGPRATGYNLEDVGTTGAVMPMFHDNRARFVAALAAAGAANPRLAGQHLAGLGKPQGYQRHFVLVVDAPADADLSPIKTLFAEIRPSNARIDVRLSTSFAADHLAMIDRLAFDI